MDNDPKDNTLEAAINWIQDIMLEIDEARDNETNEKESLILRDKFYLLWEVVNKLEKVEQ